MFAIVAVLLVGTAYSMTLTQMRSDVRSLIAETSTTYITNSEVDNWINQGMYEVSLMVCDDLLWELQTSGTQAIAVGDTTYTIPTDMVRITSAYNGSYEYTICSPTEALAFRLDDDFTGGDTTRPYLWIDANQINIYPTPTATGTLTVFYIKRPATLSSTSAECSLNKMLHHLIVYYAVAKCALKIRAFDVTQQYMKLFYDTIQIYNTRMIKKNRLEEGNAAGGGK
jgi:hypothetical protein